MKSIADNLRMRDRRRQSLPFTSTKWNQARRDRVRRQWEDWQRFRCRGSQEELDRATLGPWFTWAVEMKREEANVQRIAKAQAAMRYRARVTRKE